MKLASGIVGCILALGLTGCFSTPQNTAKKLEPLTLNIELEQASSSKLSLVATITNVSNEKLTIKVPISPNPLTVLVWAEDNHNLTHRISRRLVSDYQYKDFTSLDAGESMVIRAQIDLSKYKTRIQPNDELFVSAQYGLLQWKGTNNMPSLIYSNKIFLE
ncbi:MAG: hypothetical protein MJK04_25790 [Psychrosphaera sp.]|nr:hypothetical protein [Psychrosphaera sp.]